MILASSLPVVVSNRAPFTEFLDQACATLVDPLSDQSIADGVVRALGTGPTARQAGRHLAQNHPWSRVAELHVEHYLRLLGAAGGDDTLPSPRSESRAATPEREPRAALRRIALRPARA